MRKIGLMCLALVLALGSLGVGYAAWAEDLLIGGTVATGELDWGLTGVAVLDTSKPPPYYVGVGPGLGGDYTSRDGFAGPPPLFWQLAKNVGWGDSDLVDTDGDGDFDTIEVELRNVYPSYFNMVSVYAWNTGTIPLKIDSVVISSDYETYVLDDPPPPPYPVVKLDLTDDGHDDIEILWGDAIGTQMHPSDISPEMSFWFHVLPAAPQGATLSFTLEIVAVQWNMHPLP